MQLFVNAKKVRAVISLFVQRTVNSTLVAHHSHISGVWSRNYSSVFTFCLEWQDITSIRTNGRREIVGRRHYRAQEGATAAMAALGGGSGAR